MSTNKFDTTGHHIGIKSSACEYCGEPLPVPYGTIQRQIRNEHFATCAVRLEREAEAQRDEEWTERREKLDKLLAVDFTSDQAAALVELFRGLHDT